MRHISGACSLLVAVHDRQIKTRMPVTPAAIYSIYLSAGSAMVIYSVCWILGMIALWHYRVLLSTTIKRRVRTSGSVAAMSGHVE